MPERKRSSFLALRHLACSTVFWKAWTPARTRPPSFALSDHVNPDLPFDARPLAGPEASYVDQSPNQNSLRNFSVSGHRFTNHPKDQ